MTRENKIDNIERIKRAIKGRLGILSFDLGRRAEQLHYTTHPMSSFEHKVSSVMEAKRVEAKALKEFNEIKRLHEELFDAELKWAIANK
tara:strand:- start:495 stop:761 length:267 start_codon:yes stop_codon:yes gene_type:complete